MKIFALFAAIVGAFIGLKKRAVAPFFPAPTTDNVSSSETVATDQEIIPVSGAVPGMVSDVVETVNNVVAGTVDGTVAKVFGSGYDDLIHAAAIQYGIRPQILYNLLYAESRFRNDIITGKVRSSTGALGIAQFMPTTAIQELGSINAALDPLRAIPGAARYLAKLIRSSGSETAGIAAYNWGIGNVLYKGLKKAPGETVRYVLAINGIDITKA